MAYTIKTEGVAEISEMLSKLGEAAEGAAAMGLYDGAGVMAGEMNKAAGSIRTEPFHFTLNGTRLPSPEEKAIVEQAAAGIARFEKNGSEVNTSVGFRNAGYAFLKNKVKPIPVIVNAINSGTSFMKKQPFVRKAVNSGKGKATTAITAKIEEIFKNITKE